MFYGPDTYYGEEVSVLEMDGQFDKLEELIYMESHLSNTSAKFYGEITQQMLKNSSFPGSNNGTGLFQTIVGLKVREVFERITQQVSEGRGVCCGAGSAPRGRCASAGMCCCRPCASNPPHPLIRSQEVVVA
jgi:hypothetical protein